MLAKVAFDSEDEIEARLMRLAEPNLEELIGTRDDSREASRRKYLYESINVTRSQRLAREVREIYEGRCQICGFDPIKEYGFHLCHAHHIIWLSRGGDDNLCNLCLICPNHHNAVHAGEAIFDFANLAFTYQNGLSENIQFNKHLSLGN